MAVRVVVVTRALSRPHVRCVAWLAGAGRWRCRLPPDCRPAGTTDADDAV